MGCHDLDASLLLMHKGDKQTVNECDGISGEAFVFVVGRNEMTIQSPGSRCLLPARRNGKLSEAF